MRHPHDIVPRDDKDEILVAIFDELCAIRAALVGGADGPVRAEEVPVAEVGPEPTSSPAPPKPAAPPLVSTRPAARKKPSTRKKKA